MWKFLGVGVHFARELCGRHPKAFRADWARKTGRSGSDTKEQTARQGAISHKPI